MVFLRDAVSSCASFTVLTKARVFNVCIYDYLVCVILCWFSDATGQCLTDIPFVRPHSEACHSDKLENSM